MYIRIYQNINITKKHVVLKLLLCEAQQLKKAILFTLK